MLHEMQSAYTAQYNIAKNDMPKLVHIAPATERAHLQSNAEPKKYNYKNTPYGAQSVSIARRNARERNRVKQVNDGFSALRKKLPAAVIAALSGGSRRGSGKKLSKVDTLRMVVEYIRYMERIIEESDAALGITKVHKTSVAMDTCFDVDEGVFAGGNSPYSDSVPSPANSECSSGVSSAYSSTGYNNYPVFEQTGSMAEDDLLDAITWWQQK